MRKRLFTTYNMFQFKFNLNNQTFAQNDALSYLRRAGILWERRVRKSLNSMCTELEVTLQGQLRTGAEREELLNKWDELSNYQIGMWVSSSENYFSISLNFI